MSYYEVKIESRFSASHAIPLNDGTFEKAHLHQWQVAAVFKSEKLSQPMGVVVDFVEVQQALEKIIAPIQHADLNTLDYFKDKTTSAEQIAQYLAEKLIETISTPTLLKCVSVTEAPGCSAAYYPFD